MSATFAAVTTTAGGRAISALLWVFAGLAVAVAVLFALTGYLVFQHRRWRRAQEKRMAGEGDPKTDPVDDKYRAELVSQLTTGDLMASPSLAAPLKAWHEPAPTEFRESGPGLTLGT